MVAPAQTYASSAAPSEGAAHPELRAPPACRLHARVRLRRSILLLKLHSESTSGTCPMQAIVFRTKGSASHHLPHETARAVTHSAAWGRTRGYPASCLSLLKAAPPPTRVAR
jgi:hypothetical protein